MVNAEEGHMEPFYQSKGFYGTQQAFRFEADLHDCEVVGEVPAGLNGSLYRAGPDRQYPTLDQDVIINGDGMVSEFRFEGGHVSFRCRYVRTARMLAERTARQRLYGAYRNPFTDLPGAPDVDRDNTGNTTAFFHHGQLFALREDSHPHRIDPDTLATLPTFDFDGALASLSLSAHPKIDPVTGEWWTFGLFAKRRFDGDMALVVADRNGRLIREEHFQAPYGGISHDFAVTRDHVIFAIMPLTVDLDRVRAGGDFYAYDESLPPMWGVMPRGGTVAELRWFEAPGAFIAHVMNAYTDGDAVHIDAPVSAGNGFPFFKTVDGRRTDPVMAHLSRITLHLDAPGNRVTITPFPHAIGEMPKCDDRFQMQRYRYGYMKTRDGIARIDWDKQERLVHTIPEAPGGAQEPVFVPRSPDALEGDGWLLFLVNHNAANLAELRVVDALDITGPPVAVVRLPFNQPTAFHGCFVPR
jgi:carotenoid cleavage dioxygenase-like enzyme